VAKVFEKIGIFRAVWFLLEEMNLTGGSAISKAHWVSGDGFQGRKG